MKHGKSCNCLVCKVGKAMGMIKKEEKKSEHGDSCGSGNCSAEHKSE